MVGILRVAGPFVGDADAAGESDLAVDDQQLAVRAVVHSGEVIPARLVKFPHLDARLAPSASSSAASIFSLPTQSSSTCTLTPARARSASASANSLPIEPDQ